MFGVADYGAFVGAVILFLMIPGPGNLALITSTAKGGVRAGLAATIGLMLGDQVLIWLAVGGVAALLAASPSLFHAVQWIGASYLVWLGGRMLFSRRGAKPVMEMRPHHFLRQAMTITLMNPKAIVFYMAFFPMFVDPISHQGMLTFGFMAVTISLLTFLYGLFAVLLTCFLADRLRSNPQLADLMTRLAGICLIGFGVRLVMGR